MSVFATVQAREQIFKPDRSACVPELNSIRSHMHAYARATPAENLFF